MAKNFVFLVTCLFFAPNAALANPIGVVIADKIAVSSKMRSGESVGNLSKDDEVCVLNSSDPNWYRIYSLRAKNGWVLRSSLELKESRKIRVQG